MNFRKLKKETCEMVGMSKMISNIKYTLKHYTCNGYSLILDSIVNKNDKLYITC